MALTKVMRVDNGNIVGSVNDLILHKSIQGTTTSGGSISLDISANDYIVISVIDNMWNKPVPFVYGNTWYVNLYDTSGSSMSAKSNTSCDLSVYYMRKIN